MFSFPHSVFVLQTVRTIHEEVLVSFHECFSSTLVSVATPAVLRAFLTLNSIQRKLHGNPASAKKVDAIQVKK